MQHNRDSLFRVLMLLQSVAEQILTPLLQDVGGIMKASQDHLLLILNSNLTIRQRFHKEFTKNKNHS